MSVSLRTELVAEKRHDVVRVRIAPEHGLREHQLAVDMHVEDPVRTGHDLERGERSLPLLENARRQTGGVRERPSGNAVLDPNVASFSHRGRLCQTSQSRLRGARGIERLVDEAVSELVVLSTNRCVGHTTDLPGEARRVEEEIL